MLKFNHHNHHHYQPLCNPWPKNSIHLPLCIICLLVHTRYFDQLEAVDDDQVNNDDDHYYHHHNKSMQFSMHFFLLRFWWVCFSTKCVVVVHGCGCWKVLFFFFLSFLFSSHLVPSCVLLCSSCLGLCFFAFFASCK